MVLAWADLGSQILPVAPKHRCLGKSVASLGAGRGGGPPRVTPTLVTPLGEIVNFSLPVPVQLIAWEDS